LSVSLCGQAKGRFMDGLVVCMNVQVIRYCYIIGFIHVVINCLHITVAWSDRLSLSLTPFLTFAHSFILFCSSTFICAFFAYHLGSAEQVRR
jgi:hypothetical protein